MTKYYSQCKQDEILEETVFKHFQHGIYIDVGAHDGVSLNNTLYFHENNNWTGINIEPLPRVFEMLQKNRPKDVNIQCAV